MKNAKANELKVNENVGRWYENGGKELIEKHVIDPNGILTSNNGTLAGVYGVYVVTPDGAKIPMYYGETGQYGRGFKDRMMEHMKHWLTNPEYYTGVKEIEFNRGVKFEIAILAAEEDLYKRKMLETMFIERDKTFLQFSCYPKYDTDYRGVDLCIFPTYRRKAFLNAITSLKSINLMTLFEPIVGKVDLNDYRKLKPNQETVKKIERELPKGSLLYYIIKDEVERNLGISSKRGCNYSYLVKVVAAVLEDKREHLLTVK